MEPVGGSEVQQWACAKACMRGCKIEGGHGPRGSKEPENGDLHPKL